jgi:hypothetical protein
MADLAGETDAWSLSKRGPLKIENVDAVGHFQGRSIGFFGNCLVRGTQTYLPVDSNETIS